jgi:hypothetical protein
MHDWPFPDRIIDIPVKQDELIWDDSYHRLSICSDIVLELCFYLIQAPSSGDVCLFSARRCGLLAASECCFMQISTLEIHCDCVCSTKVE